MGTVPPIPSSVSPLLYNGDCAKRRCNVAIFPYFHVILTIFPNDCSPPHHHPPFYIIHVRTYVAHPAHQQEVAQEFKRCISFVFCTQPAYILAWQRSHGNRQLDRPKRPCHATTIYLATLHNLYLQPDVYQRRNWSSRSQSLLRVPHLCHVLPRPHLLFFFLLPPTRISLLEIL